MQAVTANTPDIPSSTGSAAGWASARPTYRHAALALLSVAGLAYYLFVGTGFSALELGRAALGLSALWGPVAMLACNLNRNVPLVQQAIRAASSTPRFCALLEATPSTYLVEYSDMPLHVSKPACLRQVWASARLPEQVTIWEVNRQ